MSPHPRIRGVATAVPSHRLPQSEMRDFAARFFADDFAELPKLLRVFDNTQIDERQTVRPREWFERQHRLTERNEIYVDGVLDISERAAREALEHSGVSRASLGAILFVSSTGIATPSLDSVLVQRLDLPRTIARVPLWGLGCAGGAAGLARAAALCRGLSRPVLLICAEACSTTFVYGDRSKSNLVATALFGDGAAAVVLDTAGQGPRILGGFSHLLDNTADVMGWTVQDSGLQVRFAPNIPQIVHTHARSIVVDALREYDLRYEDLAHFVLHPGGAKVLQAYVDALELRPDQLDDARHVLRTHGNMSSPTVLFVLERWLTRTPAPGDYGVLMGLGPGFCAEGAIIRC